MATGGPDRFHIVCTDGDERDRAQIVPGMQQQLDGAGITLAWHNGEPKDDTEWLRRIGDANGVLVYWAIPDAVLRAAPALRVISWVGTGVSTFVNLDLATERSIAVCNTPGYGNTAVAEHAVGLMFALARNTVAMHNALAAGEWPREDVGGFELAGKTVGVVGLGGIGTRVAQLCSAIGMRVIAWTRNPTDERLRVAGATYASLDDLAKGADIVSLHLLATPDTNGIVSSAFLRQMKPSAFLVNTARGELIDDMALIDALREGRIAGAALDVFVPEPLPADHPYRALPNLILTPHIGYRTPEASERTVRIAIENLIDFATGHPRNVVNHVDLTSPGGD